MKYIPRNILHSVGVLSWFYCSLIWVGLRIFWGYSLQWRHNEHDGLSNHQPHDCLLCRLFKAPRKYQSSASLAFVRGIHRWPVNSPNKGPVTRKMFPFYDVIMYITDDGKSNECPFTNDATVKKRGKKNYTDPLKTTTFTPGNLFAHIEKIRRTPCDIYVEMSILTNLTKSYVVESISSRI